MTAGQFTQIGEQSSSVTETITDADRVTEFLEAIRDPHGQAILAETSHGPRSAQELCDGCDLSPSTTYRKLDQLTSLDLLAEDTRVRSDGRHTGVYTCRVSELEVAMEAGALELSVSRTESTQH